jgi:hypothetical protein
MGGEGECWGKRVGERGQNGREKKKKEKNRSKSENRKPTIIKQTN